MQLCAPKEQSWNMKSDDYMGAHTMPPLFCFNIMQKAFIFIWMALFLKYQKITAQSHTYHIIYKKHEKNITKNRIRFFFSLKKIHLYQYVYNEIRCTFYLIITLGCCILCSSVQKNKQELHILMCLFTVWHFKRFYGKDQVTLHLISFQLCFIVLKIT